MKFNTVWISSAPRTGSMWLFNITRDIFKESGYKIFPEKIPKRDNDTIKIFNNINLNEKNHINIYVLKVHKILSHDLPMSKIISTIRDPRDICASFKEFMKSDFNSALIAAKNVIRYYEAYKTYDQNYIKIIRYEDVERNPSDIVNQIANFINCTVNKNFIEELTAKYSKNNVKKLIENNDKILEYKIKNKKEIKYSEIVFFSKKNYRSFDENTGFQTGHISKRNIGDWEKIFSDSEKEMLNKEFKEFLIEHKYN